MRRRGRGARIRSRSLSLVYFISYGSGKGPTSKIYLYELGGAKWIKTFVGSSLTIEKNE